MKKEEEMSKKFRPLRSELLRTSLDLENQELKFSFEETDEFYCSIKVGTKFRFQDHKRSFFTFPSTEEVDEKTAIIIVASDGNSIYKFYDDQLGTLALNKAELDLRGLWRPKLCDDPLDTMFKSRTFDDVQLEFVENIPPIVFNESWKREYYTDGIMEKACLTIDGYLYIRYATYILKILNPNNIGDKYHLIFNEMVDVEEVAELINKLEKGH